MATIYVHRAENGMAAITDEKENFVRYLMEHASEAAGELREFGIRDSLACGESAGYQLDELITRVAYGFYEKDSEYDLTLYGLNALEADFLECDRDPEDDLCGITVWDKTPQEAADLIARMTHDIVRSQFGEDDPGIENDEDDEEEDDEDDDMEELVWAVMRRAVEKHDAKKEAKKE